MGRYAIGLALLGLAINAHLVPGVDKPANQSHRGDGGRFRTDCYGDPLPRGALVRMGTIRFRHEDSVHSLCFSPDGKTVATSAGRLVRLWDVARRQEVRTFKIPQGKNEPVFIYGVTFSPNGKLLAAGSGGYSGGIVSASSPLAGRVWVWNTHTGKLIYALPEHSGTVYSVQFSPNGKVLAAATDNAEIDLWSMVTGKRTAVLEGQGSSYWAHSISYSSDGKTLVSGSSDGELRFWKVASGKLTRTITASKDQFISVSCSPKRNLVATGSFELCLWKADTGEKIRTFGQDLSRVNSVAFSPDARTLASAHSDGDVCLWQVASGKALFVLGGHHDKVRCVAFSADGKKVASGGSDGTLRLWNARTGKEIAPGNGHEHAIHAIVFSSDGKSLVSASYDTTLRLWDTASGKEVRRFTGHKDKVYCAALSPDGTRLASGSEDNTDRLWNVSSGKELRRHKHDSPVSGVAIAPNGKTMAAISGSCGISKVQWWEVRSGKFLGALDRQTICRSVAFFQDSNLLVFGGLGSSSNQLAVIWDLVKNRIVRTLGGSAGGTFYVVLSPDEKTLAADWPTSWGTAVRILDLATGKAPRQLRGHDRHVQTLAYSPDGKVLASGSDDNTVKLWDLATGKEVMTLQPRQGHIGAVAFAPDGRSLATGGANSTVLVWRLCDLYAGETDGHLRLERVWRDLGSEDVARAYRAMGILVNHAKESMPFLQKRVGPKVPVKAERLGRLLSDLDDESFAVREKATRELKKLGDVVKARLEKVLAEPPSAEVAGRVTRVLKSFATPPPEEWQRLRTVSVLELIGSKQSMQFLEKLGQGAPGAALTTEAQAARKRLKKWLVERRLTGRPSR
jgi:WD40 repeat protein